METLINLFFRGIKCSQLWFSVLWNDSGNAHPASMIGSVSKTLKYQPFGLSFEGIWCQLVPATPVQGVQVVMAKMSWWCRLGHWGLSIYWVQAVLWVVLGSKWPANFHFDMWHPCTVFPSPLGRSNFIQRQKRKANRVPMGSQSLPLAPLPKALHFALFLILWLCVR